MGTSILPSVGECVRFVVGNGRLVDGLAIAGDTRVSSGEVGGVGL